MAPLQFARLRPSGFRQAFTSAGRRRSAYWLSSLWLLAAFFACLWWDVLTFASSSSATGRSSRSLLQAQQKEWSGAGLQLGVARVGQVLANFAPQVSSIVVTSMVLLGVMGAAGSNDGTAGGPDWNTNVQVSVSKQQGTSDDGTAWTRITTTSMRETRVGAPMKELSKLVGSLRTTLDQAEASERLLDELASADSSRAWHLERLLWQTWYFHENPVAMTLLSEGSNLMDEGDLELAKQCFLHAATLEPSWAEAWNRLATVDYLLGNYNYSLKEIDKTLELQPRHFGALSGKGLVYLKLERFQNAIEAFQDAQEVVPTSESLKHNIEYTEALQKEAAMMMHF